jgi:hypothetical protein
VPTILISLYFWVIPKGNHPWNFLLKNCDIIKSFPTPQAHPEPVSEVLCTAEMWASRQPASDHR